MKKIIIIGNGGHATSCCDVIEQEKKFKILGFVAVSKSKDKGSNRYPYLGNDENLKNIRKKCDHAFVAIGQIKNNLIRKEIFKKLDKLKFKIPKIISPYSYVSKSTKIHNGTIIMHGAIVNAGSTIKKNCIINSNSLIEHNCIIGENCHVAPGAIINGNSSVGENTFIGSNTTIKQSTIIGKNCFLNANNFIDKNMKNNSTVNKQK